MKMWWALGCLHGAIYSGKNAIDGTGLLGADWLGRGLDAMTAVFFAVAVFYAIRAKAPWQMF